MCIRDRDTFEAPLHSKLHGARALRVALEGQPLSFALLLSSIAAVWGSHDLAGYGTANAALLALGRQWRNEGVPATAVAMGPWAVGGMVRPEENEAFARMGVRPLETAPALASLAPLLGARTPPVVLLADVDWKRFVPLVTARRPRPLFERMASVPSVEADRPAEPTHRALEELSLIHI